VRPHTTSLALSLLAAAALATAAPASATPTAAAARHAVPTNPVVAWDRVTLGILRTPGAQPPTIHPTRMLAMVSLAMQDAVEQGGANRGAASPRAALDAAAHAVLLSLYPGQQALVEGEYQTLLGQVPAGPRRDAGVALGAGIGQAVVAARADDGSAAPPPPFVPGTAPGDYQLTPPAFAPPVFTGWGAVRPFVLDAGSQFRPPAPPALTSDAWTSAYDEVQSLGSATSTTRTADETQVARFWSAPIQNYWNEIAQSAVLASHDSLARSARVFATLNETLADATIALYDAKYAYAFWRPVTAIRAGDDDGNPATVGDPAWTPLLTTPGDPSYPGAHSVISTAAADVLASFYGDRFHLVVSSEVLPGVTRSFRTFSGAAQEAGVSRIFAGVHTRLDHVAGVQLGGDVARFVLDRLG
jgi:membrane-associated phospholipid phosphatase